jgi:hypothetical protein
MTTKSSSCVKNSDFGIIWFYTEFDHDAYTAFPTAHSIQYRHNNRAASRTTNYSSNTGRAGLATIVSYQMAATHHASLGILPHENTDKRRGSVTWPESPLTYNEMNIIAPWIISSRMP